MKSSKLLSLLTALATAVLVLSGSIAVPILCRPFYYAHIEAMSMPEYTGLTVDQIKQAFDEMLDFCLGLRQDFSGGALLVGVRPGPLCRRACADRKSVV